MYKGVGDSLCGLCLITILVIIPMLAYLVKLCRGLNFGLYESSSTPKLASLIPKSHTLA